MKSSVTSLPFCQGEKRHSISRVVQKCYLYFMTKIYGLSFLFFNGMIRCTSAFTEF